MMVLLIIQQNRLETVIGRHRAHGWRNAVGAEDQGRVFGSLVGLVDEDRSLLAQSVDDVSVVDDLVADVDGGPESFERPLDDLDGAIDAGAEAAGVGEEDFHRAPD